MAGQLDGKIAVVTGSGAGIGAEIAREFGKEGATVVVSDLDAAAGTAVAASIPGAVAIACDVRKPAEVEALVAETVKRFGRLDVMVPNAGVASVVPLATMSYEQFREVTSVNLDGVFLAIRYAAPAMMAAGGGTFVTIASITAQAAIPLIGHYAAAKAGVVSLTQTVAVEMRAHGIRANAILPAFLETDMVHRRKKEFETALNLPSFDGLIEQKQGRYGTVHEVARLAVFLASSRSSFSNGCSFTVDGGVRATLL